MWKYTNTNRSPHQYTNKVAGVHWKIRNTTWRHTLLLLRVSSTWLVISAFGAEETERRTALEAVHEDPAVTESEAVNTWYGAEAV